MKQVMQAIVFSDDRLQVQEVERPQEAEAGHLLIRMVAAAINNGDKFFLRRASLPGVTQSLQGIRGVSGVGKVIRAGDGVPAEYEGRYVTIYRQLSYSEQVVGTWSEYAHLPWRDCAILPDGVDPVDYAGSMVNIITPLAFLHQIREEGHRGIISTAGSSATGLALLGFCKAYDVPLLSIVRSEDSRVAMEALGAEHVLAQSAVDFDQQLGHLAQALKATAVFEGVGGEVLNRIIPSLAWGTVIYSYGYMGDAIPLTVPMSTLALKNITIKPFMNMFTPTVQHPERLAAALKEIAGLIHQPYFRTKLGPRFALANINEAIGYVPAHGEKAVLDLGA